jgi:hypothetical protein
VATLGNYSVSHTISFELLIDIPHLLSLYEGLELVCPSPEFRSKGFKVQSRSGY